MVVDLSDTSPGAGKQGTAPGITGGLVAGWLAAIAEADKATAGGSTAMLLVAIDAAERNRGQPLIAQDKLTALSLYWTTTLNARLITRLANYR